MTWAFSAEDDTLTITFGGKAPGIERREQYPHGVVELDAAGGPVRVVLPQASRLCPAGELGSATRPHRPGEKLLSVPAAAGSLGIPAHTLRRGILAGAVPVVHAQSSWCLRPCVVRVAERLLELLRAAGTMW